MYNITQGSHLRKFNMAEIQILDQLQIGYGVLLMCLLN